MSVMLSRYSERTLMVPFTAYFDASGTSNTDVITVAGFVSTVKKWARFERSWQTILKRERVTCFHMTDFVSNKGEFASGWKGKTERRRVFVGELASCIRDNVNKSFRITMVVKDYDKVNKVFDLGNGPGVPYALCSIMRAYKLRLWAKKREGRQASALLLRGRRILDGGSSIGCISVYTMRPCLSPLERTGSTVAGRSTSPRGK